MPTRNDVRVQCRCGGIMLFNFESGTPVVAVVVHQNTETPYCEIVEYKCYSCNIVVQLQLEDKC